MLIEGAKQMGMKGIPCFGDTGMLRSDQFVMRSMSGIVMVLTF